MNKNKLDTVVAVRLTHEESEKLNALCSRLGKSKSSVLRHVIKGFLPETVETTVNSAVKVSK